MNSTNWWNKTKIRWSRNKTFTRIDWASSENKKNNKNNKEISCKNSWWSSLLSQSHWKPKIFKFKPWRKNYQNTMTRRKRGLKPDKACSFKVRTTELNKISLENLLTFRTPTKREEFHRCKWVLICQTLAKKDKEHLKYTPIF